MMTNEQMISFLERQGYIFQDKDNNKITEFANEKGFKWNEELKLWINQK